MMDLSSLKDYLAEDWRAVQRLMTSALRCDIDILEQVNASILSSSGKQLRPLVSLLVARMCSREGKVSEATIRYAAASELLHNATLLHDDVADSSDIRRGKPTVRALMGPSASVLVGDFWLVRAIDLIRGGDGFSPMDMEAVGIFSKTLGDLAQGEMLQLQKAQECDTTLEDYEKIIYCKTASLFEASWHSAALSVEADKEVCRKIIDFSVNLGLAFQVRDDILDNVGDAAVGKPLGVDLLEHKMTAPLLCALECVSAGKAEEIRRKVASLESGNNSVKDEIMKFVAENDGVAHATRMLGKYMEKALDALDMFPESFEKQALVQLARFTAERNC